MIYLIRIKYTLKGGKNMGDRRVGDRRDKENGVIRVKFTDAVKYLIVAVILIISISANIVLIVRINQYKQALELFEYSGAYYDEQDDEINST